MIQKKAVGGYVYSDEIQTNGQLSLLRPGNSSNLDLWIEDGWRVVMIVLVKIQYPFCNECC